MKIQSVGPSDSISKYKNSLNGISPKESHAVNISDSVELSEGAQKYSSLLKAAKEAVEKAETDEKMKAADIMRRMEEGSYRVSSDDVTKDILRGYPSKG